MAGAGGGTVLVLLAEQLPDGTPYKPYLLIIAPTLAIVLSALWLRAKRALDHVAEIREADKVLTLARATLTQAELAADSDPEHLKRLKTKIDELELIKMQILRRRMRLLITSKEPPADEEAEP